MFRYAIELSFAIHKQAQENLEYMRKTSVEHGALIDANDELFSKYVK